MKVTLEEINPTKKRLLVEIGPEEVGQRIEKAFRETGRSARIPGFRPGKAPRKVLESYFGRRIKDEVGRELVVETLPKAVEEASLKAITFPVVESSDIDQGMSLRYSAVLDVYPKFELGNYLGLEIDRTVVPVSDDNVDRQIGFIRESYGKLEPLSEGSASRLGDFVVITYQAFEGEQPIKDAHAENLLLRLGSNEFHQSFEQALVGLKKGDKTSFTVTFEDTFPRPAFAGKSVSFKVEIQDVKELKLPELNDEFVASLNSTPKTVAEFREAVRAELEEQGKKRADFQAKRALIESICKDLDVPLPEALVNEETSMAVEEVVSNITRSGATLEKVGLTREKLWQNLRPRSEQRVKEMMVLEEIAVKEGIEIGEEELDHEFAMIAASSNQDAAAIKQFYAQRGLLGSFRRRLREEKTLNYLLQHAKISDVSGQLVEKPV
jgi:trigger factor